MKTKNTQTPSVGQNPNFKPQNINKDKKNSINNICEKIQLFRGSFIQSFALFAYSDIHFCICQSCAKANQILSISSIKEECTFKCATKSLDQSLSVMPILSGMPFISVMPILSVMRILSGMLFLSVMPILSVLPVLSVRQILSIMPILSIMINL